MRNLGGEGIALTHAEWSFLHPLLSVFTDTFFGPLLESDGPMELIKLSEEKRTIFNADVEQLVGWILDDDTVTHGKAARKHSIYCP